MGDIGRPVRHIEFEPLPEEAPEEGSPAVAPEPVPVAPEREPEEVPA